VTGETRYGDAAKGRKAEGVSICYREEGDTRSTGGSTLPQESVSARVRDAARSGGELHSRRRRAHQPASTLPRMSRVPWLKERRTTVP
jgi:hypothetical protein